MTLIIFLQPNFLLYIIMIQFFLCIHYYKIDGNGKLMDKFQMLFEQNIASNVTRNVHL